MEEETRAPQVTANTYLSSAMKMLEENPEFYAALSPQDAVLSIAKYFDSFTTFDMKMQNAALQAVLAKDREFLLFILDKFTKEEQQAMAIEFNEKAK